MFGGETSDVAVPTVLSSPILRFFEIVAVEKQCVTAEVCTAFRCYLTAGNSTAWSYIIYSILRQNDYGSGQNGWNTLSQLVCGDNDSASVCSFAPIRTTRCTYTHHKCATNVA